MDDLGLPLIPEDEIDKMKVRGLKAALKKRRQSVSGLKAVLQDRLKEYMTLHGTEEKEEQNLPDENDNDVETVETSEKDKNSSENNNTNTQNEEQPIEIAEQVKVIDEDVKVIEQQSTENNDMTLSDEQTTQMESTATEEETNNEPQSQPNIAETVSVEVETTEEMQIEPTSEQHPEETNVNIPNDESQQQEDNTNQSEVSTSANAEQPPEENTKKSEATTSATNESNHQTESNTKKSEATTDVDDVLAALEAEQNKVESTKAQKRSWTHMDENGNFVNGEEKTKVKEHQNKRQKTESSPSKMTTEDKPSKPVLAKTVKRTDIFRSLNQMADGERTQFVLEQIKKNPQFLNALRNKLSNHNSFCKLFVRGLTETMEEDTLNKIYGRYGELSEVRILRDSNHQSRNIGFLIYKNCSSALKALERPERKINTGRTIFLNLACKPNNRNPKRFNNQQSYQQSNNTNNYYRDQRPNTNNMFRQQY